MADPTTPPKTPTKGKGGKWNKKVAGLPQWGWAALGGSALAGYIIIKRRQKAAAASSAGDGLTAASAPLSSSSTPWDGGGWGGGGGTSGGGSSTPTSTETDPTTTPTSTSSTTGSTTAPTVGASTIPVQSLANTPAFAGTAGPILQQTVSNPAGTSDAIIAQNAALKNQAKLAGNYPYDDSYVPYTPSQTDLASEQPGGLQYSSVAAPSNSSQSGTYTVYNTTTGSGPVVPQSQRIVGERYDSLGRVIQ